MIHFTPKERAVIRCLLHGYSHPRTASELGMSIETVKGYVYSLYDKTGMSSRVELAMKILHSAELLDQVFTLDKRTSK